MRYQNKSELPETLQLTLPEEAQDVYIRAFNDATREETPTPGGELSQDAAAHSVAWQAVEREFERSAHDGKWYRKGEAPSPEEAAQGLMEKIKNLF